MFFGHITTAWYQCVLPCTMAHKKCEHTQVCSHSNTLSSFMPCVTGMLTLADPFYVYLLRKATGRNPQAKLAWK